MQARDNQLFEIKENLPDVTVPRRRSLMGLSCQSCAPVSRVSHLRKYIISFDFKIYIMCLAIAKPIFANVTSLEQCYHVSN